MAAVMAQVALWMSASIEQGRRATNEFDFSFPTTGHACIRRFCRIYRLM